MVMMYGCHSKNHTIVRGTMWQRLSRLWEQRATPCLSLRLERARPYLSSVQQLLTSRKSEKGNCWLKPKKRLLWPIRAEIVSIHSVMARLERSRMVLLMVSHQWLSSTAQERTPKSLKSLMRSTRTYHIVCKLRHSHRSSSCASLRI